jgi:hypothetical protein
MWRTLGAMQIVRAHLIPGTLTWTELQKRINSNKTTSYTSLEGFVWKLKNVGEPGKEYPVVDDKTNRTGVGYYNIQVDGNAIDAGVWCAIPFNPFEVFNCPKQGGLE